MAKLESYECVKCCGRGKIDAYSSICNGVCFACNGKGRVYHEPRPVDPPVHILDGQINAKRFKWMMSVTPEKFATLTHEQHMESRKWVYWATRFEGGQQVLDRYKAELEHLFFESQERVNEAYDREHCPWLTA